MTIDRISASSYQKSDTTNSAFNNQEFNDRGQDTLLDFLKEAVHCYSTSGYARVRAEFERCVEQYATGEGVLKEIEIINRKQQPKIFDVLSYMNKEQAQRFSAELFEDMVPMFHSRAQTRDVFVEGKSPTMDVKVQGSFISRWLMKFLAKNLSEDDYMNAMVFSNRLRWVDDDKKNLTIKTKMF